MSESPTYHYARLVRLSRAELNVRWAEQAVADAQELSPAKRAAATRAYNKVWGIYADALAEYKTYQTDHPQFPQVA